ncbi:MAG: radical SAM protein [Bacteroidota bacterium]
MKKFDTRSSILLFPPKVKLIWNITKICPYDCGFCCVDAYHVTRKGNDVIIRTHCLSKVHRIGKEKGEDAYQGAYKYLVEHGFEITLQDKLKVLENMDINTEIDFSGGDPLLLKENRTIIERASKKFGIQNISITATGIGFSKTSPDSLINLAGNIDFTYDSPEIANVPYRPNSYNVSNLRKVFQLKKYGMHITAQIPLTLANMTPGVIEKIFLNLHENGIDKALLMKFFPVGRGSVSSFGSPSADEYKKAIEVYQQLGDTYKYPVVTTQTALKTIISENPEDSSDYPSSHLVINQKGILSTSPWAVNGFGEPLPDFIIGDLKKSKLSVLLDSQSISEKGYKERLMFIFNKAASILY